MPIRNSELIDRRLARALKLGEAPYQANRKAVRALDIDGNVSKGDKELKLMLSSMGAFISELEGVADASDAVVRRISSGVH